jgi:hypothetical protein
VWPVVDDRWWTIGPYPAGPEETLTAMSCTCPTGLLSPLGSDPEQVFPWAGVLVLGIDYETYVAAAGDRPTAIAESLAWGHGVVHFTQALGSQLLQNHGLRLLKAGREVVSANAGAGAAARRFTQESEFLTRPAENGWSPWDLLEAVAGVEAIRLLPRMAGVATPSPWPAFDWLAGLLDATPGGNDANELFAFLAFFAFMTNEPCRTFAGLAEMAAADADTWKSARAVEVLDHFEWGAEFDAYWDHVSAGEPVGTPYIVDPLREAMRRIGRSRLLELLARAAAHLPDLDEHMLRAVLPPVMVYPSRAGGLVHHLNGIALDDGGRFAGDALAEVGIFGAARQLVQRTEAAYCDHIGCPHRASGLCHQWFNPPGNETGHAGCDFVRVFTHYAGQDPAATWSRVDERT